MKRKKFAKGKNRHKKRLIILFVFISLCILIFCPQKNVFVFASDNSSTSDEKLNENILDQLEKLNLEELQEYVDSLGSFSNENVAERLIDYIKGEKFDYASFGKELLSVLFEKVGELFPAFACISAIALLSGIISSLGNGRLASSSGEIVFLISFISALVPLLVVLTECFSETQKTINSMQKQMHAVYPLMLTLMATSGSTLSASIYRPAVAFFSGTIVSTIKSVVLPLSVTILLFSMASNLTKELKIGKFTAFFKSINKWIIGVCVSVFGIFFTLQGLTSASYDGVMRRAAKYAIGNGVPIVGGFLSGGFDLAVAGSVLIKNSLGGMSIFLLVFALFEPIVLLISVNVLLRLTAAIAQPFGDSRISDFLGETADNLHYLSASLLFTAFLYFLTIILMVYSTEALF